MNAVKIEQLVKSYAHIKALKGLSFTVPKGIIFGLLGPNGAGKSTLIKILVGALRSTSGEVRVVGLDPVAQRSQLSKKLGYMPQAPALYEDLSARENIRFFGRLQHVERLEHKITETLEFTELIDRADDLVRTFSGGMKKRVSLACALIHNPSIVFLDEPTAAVDPHLKVKTWQLFRKLCQSGVTLVVSTHLMDEALLCDSLAIISQGELIAYEAPSKILEKGSVRIKVQEHGTEQEVVTGATPVDLAHALQPFGLRNTVQQLQVQHDSLEAIILKLLEERRKI